MTAAVATIGHNQATPFDLISDEIEGLFIEAKNWLDGEGVQTETDAENIAKLLDMTRAAAKRADALRVEEKKPHDDAAKAVQARFKPLLDRAELVASTAKKALTPYLAKKEEEQRRAAEQARLEAEAAERAAQEAFAKSGASDLEAREQAEALAKAAKSANATANRMANDKAQAKGGARAVGLRTAYRAEITDMNAFARWCWINSREDLEECLNGIAKRRVAANFRDMPGVTVHEEKVAV